MKQNNPEEYLDKLYQRRHKILEKVGKRKKNKAEQTHRKSKFNKKRMQLLA